MHRRTSASPENWSRRPSRSRRPLPRFRHAAPVFRIFVAGDAPFCEDIRAAHERLDPIEVDLVYAFSPQAIATIVGSARGVSVDNSENELSAIWSGEISCVP